MASKRLEQVQVGAGKGIKTDLMTSGVGKHSKYLEWIQKPFIPDITGAA